MTGLPDSIAIALPPQWTDIPLDQKLRGAMVDKMISDLAEAGVSRAQQRQAELMLARLAWFARQESILSLSSYIGRVAADSDELVLASMVLSSRSRQELSLSTRFGTASIIAAMENGDDSEDSAGSYSWIEPPEEVMLRELRAVRLRRLLSSSLVAAEELKLYTESYLIPVAEGEGLVTLQFGTPNLEESGSFSTLFQAIAESLRVLYPGDPTFAVDSDTKAGVDGE